MRCASGHAASCSGRAVPTLAPASTPRRHPATHLHFTATRVAQRPMGRSQSTKNNGPSGNTLAEDAERFARDAQKRAAAFAEEQRLQERAGQAASAAQASLSEAFQRAKADASRTYMKLESEYEISARAGRAQRRAAEAATDLDQTFSVRRRLRNAVQHVQRMWPVWQTRLNELGTTWYGKVLIFGAIVAVLSTPLFWRALNVGLLLWWLALPLSLVAMEAARRKAAEELAAEEAAEQQRAAESPLESMFRAFSGAVGGQAAARGGRGGRGAAGGVRRPAAKGSGGAARGSEQQDGPVIEAEWSPLDGK